MSEKSDRFGIGVDLGGTSIKSAIVGTKGEIIHQDLIPINSADSAQNIFNSIFQVIENMMHQALEKSIHIDVIGMGTPGSVDVGKGFLVGSTPNFKYWRNVYIKKEIENKFAIPTFVDNDANLMAMGESAFGAGRDVKDLICLTIGTGIGGGIIIDNDLYRGYTFCGAELGHMSINYNGRKCNCGGTGCLEQYASATAMIREYCGLNSEKDKDSLNVKKIFEKMEQGNHIAKQVIHRAAFYLGVGISNLINIFNPQKVVLGGGVAEAGESFIANVRNVVQARAMELSYNNVKIVMAQLGNQAGFAGAVKFAFQQKEN